MEQTEMRLKAVAEGQEGMAIKAAPALHNAKQEASVAEVSKGMVDLSDIEQIKIKYGEVYQIELMVDEDDISEGRKLAFVFKKPTMASFNRYLKTASKNMAVSTTTFVQDNIIDEQAAILEAEGQKYPGLSLAIGTKLLSAIGLVDNVNFKIL